MCYAKILSIYLLVTAHALYSIKMPLVYNNENCEQFHFQILTFVVLGFLHYRV